MNRNIRAGERPLFPFHSPKYITNLTKKCWATDPYQRPGFSSICRNLRYAKRFLAMNPKHSQIDAPMPPIDFGEIELGIVRGFPLIGNSNLMSIWQIPFQMSAYRVTERERANVRQRENSESGSDGASTCDESVVPVEDPFTSPPGRKSSLPSPQIMIRKISMSKKFDGSQNPQTARYAEGEIESHTPTGRAMGMNSEGQLR
ncbi:hypothetical protein ACP275_02G105300 [Erythranthe tilingii]